MPRFRSSLTGVVVRVSDATATRLGAEWKPVAKVPRGPLVSRESNLDVPAQPKGNASRQVWADYADAQGIAYAEDATRNEIKAAVAGRD